MENQELAKIIHNFLKYSYKDDECPFVIDLNENDLEYHDSIFIHEWVNKVFPEKKKIKLSKKMGKGE